MVLHPLIRQSLVQQSLVQLASLFLFLLKMHLQYLRKVADNICMHFGDCVYIESNKSTINIVKNKPFRGAYNNVDRKFARNRLKFYKMS